MFYPICTFFLRRLAMVKPIVGSMSDWSGLLKDFFRQIDDGSIVHYQLKAFLEHRAPFTTLPDINWPLTYEKLGLTAEYAEASKKLVLPEENSNLWVCPMVPGVTPNRVVASYRKLKVDVWTYYDDLDANVHKNDRDPNCDGAYLAGFRRTIEADDEFANKSANQLAEIGHQGIVLVERLVLGFGFFVTTGQHLDVKTATLCTGSRDGDGCVPRVVWSSGLRRVCVFWCSPSSSYDSLRSRLLQFLSLAKKA